MRNQKDKEEVRKKESEERERGGNDKKEAKELREGRKREGKGGEARKKGKKIGYRRVIRCKKRVGGKICSR